MVRKMLGYLSLRRALLFTALLLVPASASAAAGDYGLDLATMGMGLFGGLALFLFGMEQMAEALKSAAGEQMKRILARLTTNRFSGALTGSLVTAVIQSSSVTTVLVVGFVSAGLMSLPQSIGVIMGANIGTTITAQIVAFKVSEAALLLVASGFFVLFFGKQEKSRHYGGIIMGLGLVFYGMNVMSEVMYPLRSYEPFLDLMVKMERPAYGILIGGAFTALVQSSSATTGMVIVMASQGFISLPAGIALALGANIGTCVTAMLAAIGKPRVALRAASVHVIFNVLGVLVWLPFIGVLAEFSVLLSPVNQALEGAARLAAEGPRQIANANTIFNVLNAALFIGFSGPLARGVQRLFPDRPAAEIRDIIRPKYLDDQILETPSLALNLARLELGRLGEQVLLMLAQIKGALESRDTYLLREIEKMDDSADILHAHIVAYLSRIGKQTLTEAENAEFYLLTHAAGNLEGIGDVIETDLVALGHTFVKEDLEPSETMGQLISSLHAGVCQAVDAAVRAVTETDQKAAQEVIALKSEIGRRVDAAFRRQADSLALSPETRIATLRAEFEVIDRLKHIYSLAKRIARLQLPPEV